MSWVGDPYLFLPVDKVSPRLAASGTTLIALHEYRLEADSVWPSFPLAPGFHYMAVEAIAAARTPE